MATKVDLSFPHEYEVEVDAELPGCPGRTKVIYYPEGEELASHGGLAVKIRPKNGAPWIGIFADHSIRDYYNGVLSCPDPNTVCVISGGAGYLVRVDNPVEFEEVNICPIVDACPAIDAGLIIFVDFTELAAYGRDGELWDTERLAYDGVRITEITKDSIRGMGWSCSLNDEFEFVVDMKTGKHEGGGAFDIVMIE